jgi:hypothetical protein
VLSRAEQSFEPLDIVEAQLLEDVRRLMPSDSPPGTPSA